MTLSCGGVWKGKEKGEYEVIHSEVSLTGFAPPPLPLLQGTHPTYMMILKGSIA